MNNICVIGVGYVGLVTGTCFADLGNQVVALDINEKRIENLKKTIMPIYEPGLKEIAERNINAGRLKFTTDYKEALKDAEFAFICVGTPEGVDGEADLQYVRMAAESIAKNMDHSLIVINKSTVPVGTGDWVAGIIRDNQPRPIPFSVVSCPEFLREGSAIRDFSSPDRTVLGSTDKEAANRVAQLHLPLRAPIVVTDLRTAEMIKYASNAFLATRISFINEIANICEMLGADVKEVAQGMGYDKRIGHHFLESGVGYGGSCFLGSETVLTMNSGNMVPVTLEALFAASGKAFVGDSVEVTKPHGKHVLAFDLGLAKPALATLKAVTRRSYDGIMVNLLTSGKRALKVTADHPVILVNKSGFDIVAASDVTMGDQMIALSDIPSLGSSSARDWVGILRDSEITADTVISVQHEKVLTLVYSLETSTETVLLSSQLVAHNCFPKDVKALAYMAQVHGTHPQLLQAVMDINMTQRRHIVLKLQDELGTLKDKAISLLGLAFKENTDDIRESPALDIAAMLHDQGAVLRGYDPVAMENVARVAPYLNLAEDPYELASGADALVVATPWNEFKSLDLKRIRSLMKQPIIIDGRNMYNPTIMKELGFKYRGVGRGFRGAMEDGKDGE